MPSALVVGGTGPTGPYLVGGLRERGYDVTIFHRGTHEISEIPPDVAHIHGDPHFPETIARALEGLTFDLALVTYGRVRHLADALAGRVGRFVSVGGMPVYRGYWDPAENVPAGMAVPVAEAGPVAGPHDNRFGRLIRETEEAVLAAHPSAAHFRYPYVYGPYQVSPREWSVVRRVLDGRRSIIVADGGHSVITRGFAQNLAHAVLLAVDEPDRSAGQIYNCGDEVQYSVRQWIELVAGALGAELELISLPDELAAHADPLQLDGRGFHRVLDLHKVRAELGYADVVSVPDAVRRTVDWLVAHRPPPGGHTETDIGDRFDYAAEDELVRAYRSALQQLRPLAPARPEGYSPHSYAHPQQADQPRDHRNR
jgi:nucleoside-diphosphate-sugar epimerase